MPHEALTQLCSVCTYEQFDDDQPIARLGARTAAADGGTEANASHPSRGLCVLLFGEVRLTRRAPSGQTAHVATLHAGDHFGENTLLYKAYRQASARAAARTGLVVVDDSQLRRTLQRAELEQAAERAFFVASVPMFAKLPWERLLRMVGLLKPVEFAHGEAIVRQDEVPQGLYIVHEGRCTVLREIRYVEHGAERMRRMHLETLMPRDTYGGDAVLHGAVRSRTTLLAETDCRMLFMPRADFSPSHLTEEALRILKLNSKLYRPNDELLLQRHFQEREWERAKHHFVRQVLKDAEAKRNVKALNSRNPATMRRSSEASR